MTPSTHPSLADYGWRPFFQSQIDLDNEADLRPARVLAVHLGAVVVGGPDLEALIPLPAARFGADEDAPTVGDWVLVDPKGPIVHRRLDRFAVFKRRAAGTDRRVQLIAANVDTLFIVTSADRDFNVARLERYLAVAREGGATPVIVVTKADLNGQANEMAGAATRLARGVLVECLDARDPAAVAVLSPWCGPGQTVALIGSSGVGKSTLVNTLAQAHQATTAVRADDQRGRHTTTARSMHRLADGGWLVDTPGMRELQLVDAADALEDVFAEIADLARGCRFSDCRHVSEPGCAVRAAIAEGRLDEARLARFRKLAAEDRRNSEGLAKRRARDRALGHLYRTVLREKNSRRGDL